MSSKAPEIVKLGRVVGLFGVQGWVKVFSYTEPREAILDYASWLLDDAGSARRVAIEDGRRQGKSVLAKLAGCDDRDSAEQLLGLDIAVPRAELPALEGNRFYWTDLLGLTVEHKDGRRLGVIREMLETGAHDVMRVEGEEKQRLIPFVTGQIVKQVDLDAGVVRVDWEWDA